MSQSTPTAEPDQVERVDVRGPRFGATITMVVLATAVVVQGPVGIVLTAYAVAQFAISTFAGITASPNARIFRAVRDRFDLGPATETEPVGPPTFSQLCGLLFTGPGLVLVLAGFEAVGWVLVGVVLALSALLSLTGFCVGCELYILGQRLRARGA